MFSFKSNILNHDRHIEENRKFNCRPIMSIAVKLMKILKKKLYNILVC